MADRTVSTEFEFKSGGGERVVNDLNKIQKEVRKAASQMDKEYAGVGKTAIKLTDDLEQRTGRLGQIAGQAGAALRGLGLEGLGNAIMTIADVSDLLESSSKAAGDFVKSGAEVPKLLSEAGEGSSAAATGLAATGMSLGTILAVAAPVAIALGVFALAIGDVQRRAEEAKKATESGVKEQLKFSELLATANTEQAKAALENESKRVAVLMEQRNAIAELAGEGRMLLGMRDNVANAEDIEKLKEATRAFADKAQELGFDVSNGIDVSVFEDTLDTIDSDLNATIAQYDKLDEALKSNAFAANDAAEAAKQLTQSNLTLAQAAGDYARFQQEAVRLNQDQLEQRLDAIERERNALNTSIETLKATGDTSSEASIQMANWIAKVGELTQQEQYLMDVVAPLAAETERLAQAEEAAKEAAEELVDTSEKLAQAAASAAKAQDGYNQKLEDITDEVGKRLAEAAREQSKALNEAYANAADDRKKIIASVQDDLNEAERKALLDRQDAQRDHEKAIRKIIKDGSRDQQTAIEDRDAVALDRAQRATQDALDEENAAYGERLRDIDRALGEENRQINKRYIQQLQEVDARLRQQVQQIVTRYNEQVMATYQYGNEQRALAKRQLDQQLKDLSAGLNLETQYKRAANNAMAAGAKVYHDYLLALAANLKAKAAQMTSGSSRSGGGGAKKPIQFAVGGNYQGGTLAQVNDGYPGQRETFNGVPFPAGEGLFMGLRSGRINAGTPPINANVTINGTGLNPGQLERVVTRSLLRVIQEA